MVTIMSSAATSSKIGSQLKEDNSGGSVGISPESSHPTPTSSNLCTHISPTPSCSEMDMCHQAFQGLPSKPDTCIPLGIGEAVHGAGYKLVDGRHMQGVALPLLGLFMGCCFPKPCF